MTNPLPFSLTFSRAPAPCTAPLCTPPPPALSRHVTQLADMQRYISRCLASTGKAKAKQALVPFLEEQSQARAAAAAAAASSAVAVRASSAGSKPAGS